MEKNNLLFFGALIVGIGIIFVALNQAYSTGSAVSTKCVDSDGGLNYDVYGYVTYKSSTYYDSCSTSNRLIERYCNRNRASYKDYFCSYGCLNGACKPSCIPATCSSLGKDCGSWSDGCGNTLNCGNCPLGQICSNGQCIQQCTPNCVGKECGNDGCGGSCGVCIPGEVCSSGICKIPDSCLDSDGGVVVSIQGTASGYFNEQYYSKTDLCLSDEQLLEYYCTGTKLYNSTVSCMPLEYAYAYNKTTSCSSGACV